MKGRTVHTRQPALANLASARINTAGALPHGLSRAFVGLVCFTGQGRDSVYRVRVRRDGRVAASSVVTATRSTSSCVG